MDKSRKIVFVTHPHMIDAEIPGGVQLCSREFIKGLQAADFEVQVFPITHTKRILHRIRRRFGLDIYSEFDSESLAGPIVSFLERTNSRHVVFNGSGLIRLCKLIRERMGGGIRLTLLSHGNESGDTLGDLIQLNHKLCCLKRFFSSYRLGGQIIEEAKHRKYIDHVFCLSRTEQEVEKWLGSTDVTYLPRVVEPDFLDWQPSGNLVGYVGTLEHLPNLLGLKLFLDEQKRRSDVHFRVRVIGGPEDSAKKHLQMYSQVDYLGRVSEAELKNEVSTWSFFIHPIFWYARGASMKVAQALSWGIPIISTEAGMRGYEFSKGKVVICRKAGDMVSLISETIHDVERLNRFAEQTRLAAKHCTTYEEVGRLFKLKLNE